MNHLGDRAIAPDLEINRPNRIEQDQGRKIGAGFYIVVAVGFLSHGIFFRAGNSIVLAVHSVDLSVRLVVVRSFDLLRSIGIRLCRRVRSQKHIAPNRLSVNRARNAIKRWAPERALRNSSRDTRFVSAGRSRWCKQAFRSSICKGRVDGKE